MDERRPRLGLAGGVLANLLMFGVLAYAWWLQESDLDLYFAAVQEDEHLEWASFWGFAGAAGLYVAVAWRQWRTRQVLPWFAVGVALFCFLVAMEEISWGQRVFGFRPPAYFLENNFQQETNVHNIMGDFVRMRTFESVIGLFGIALAVAGLHPTLAATVRRYGINAPPGELIPGFAAALFIFVEQPWDFSSELSELMVGLGFLFAALPWLVQGDDERAGRPSPRGGLAMVAIAAVFAVGLGLGNASISNTQRSSEPQIVTMAQGELEALATDFRQNRDGRRRFRVGCGYHRRLYTYAQRDDRHFVNEGVFAGLIAQGLPDERSEFLIDPWNSPYWLRAKCNEDQSRITILLYSFGPNRLRNSSEWELGGDDVGVYLARLEDGVDTAGGTPPTGSSSSGARSPGARSPGARSPNTGTSDGTMTGDDWW